ncbi:lipopolysaccharide biosynthesis protein [Vibrio proteolyticus]|uniref:Capsular biosynthesis protein n=1 Tax=Vibrio proteolyticus NBRC 13287 TaxID=1219065 RepID=U3A1M6_VIBPR|nr:hypothetical protein [Vibrio proteolyticus]GAD67247.1 hypothetical protein VPR01S_07_00460 [Vibrio proteolyticus NBRC 13287]
MSLIRSITTIAGSSVMSQAIGALSIWLISHYYGMAEVGNYALTYSIVLIGAQVCMFASQLILPKQQEECLSQNIVFCLVQTTIIAIPYAIAVAMIFNRSVTILYVLTLCHAWILVSENLLLRVEKMKLLALQRMSASLVVMSAILLSHSATQIYQLWAAMLLIMIVLWLSYSIDFKALTWSQWTPAANWQFFLENRSHIMKVGSAEVLAMANSNLPTILINFWFSALTAGYFAVVSRFCLAPVIIVGNAVRNSIFSKWSIDFRNSRFNYDEFIKVRKLLFVLGLVASAGVFIFYPIVMQLGFSDEWIESIPTSRYMLPYLFPALAVCPLTVIELVFGSPKYFLRIQVEQLLVVVAAFVVLPYFYNDYAYSVLAFALLSALRYAFIYVRVNQRARSLKRAEGVTIA